MVLHTQVYHGPMRTRWSLQLLPMCFFVGKHARREECGCSVSVNNTMSLEIIFCVCSFVFWDDLGGCLCFSCYFCLHTWAEYVEDDYQVWAASAPVATFSLCQHTVFGIVFICNITAVSSSMVSSSLSISLTILSPIVAASWVRVCCAHRSSCMVQHMALLWKLGLCSSILT